MSDNSKIEWTDATWNPIRGCTKISPGCKHCYAETFAERWRGIPGHPFEQGFDLRTVPESLVIPLRWAKPRTIFVNSMADTFHADVEAGYIRKIFDVMREADWHVFQVLTKRAERMRDVVSDLPAELRGLKHVWLGVSVEDRKYGIPRIEHLRSTPAAVRFLSIEPLLEDLGELDLRGIDWVIVGGESGRKARPMHPKWVRSIIRQCLAAGVRAFFKQWGEWEPIPWLADGPQIKPVTDPEIDAPDGAVVDGYERISTQWSRIDEAGRAAASNADWTHVLDPGGNVRARTRFEARGELQAMHNAGSALIRKVGKSKAGRTIDGRTWDEMPEIRRGRVQPLAGRRERAERLGLRWNVSLPIAEGHDGR